MKLEVERKDVHCPNEKCGGVLHQHPRIDLLLVCEKCRGIWELLRFNAAHWKRPDSLEFEDDSEA